ncbi:MAG: hypothetical protein KUG78_02275 [Kangiellaceae bacterium]|nr:hypothetical protein [Kangiellaceae bacterium]
MALYSNDGKRHFFRQPVSDILKKIEHNLRPSDKIVLYHSDEYEKNGGQLIIELQSNTDMLVSLEDTIQDQESKYTAIN